MSVGAHSTIEYLAQKLLQRWVLKWYEAFTDGADGGFHERLGHSFKPVVFDRRRVLTQCRQLAIYSDAYNVTSRATFNPDLNKHFEYISSNYYVAKIGGWAFSVNLENNNKELFYDLYAQAFVIFSFSHYFRATKDIRAKELAYSTFDFILENFIYKNAPGYYEALDESLRPMDNKRRHESHMHFLEACLFAYEVWEDDRFLKEAEHLIKLFTEYFYQEKKAILSEYFSNDLKEPLKDKGHIITEPGHYYEWIWLLKKYENFIGQKGKFDILCMGLLTWANDFGWDKSFGGIYDELDHQGNVVEDTKRIWPFSEGLKANTLLLDSSSDKLALKNKISEMVEVFKTHYIDERGFWTEWLDRELKPATDYMPGTTPYHVYFGIMEARQVLHSRGKTKSMLSGAYIMGYTLRRALSNKSKALWRKIVVKA
jgi:mannose-6-phosphate isomerase